MKIRIRSLVIFPLLVVLVLLGYGLSFLPSSSGLLQSVQVMTPAFTQEFVGIVKYNVALGDCVSLSFDVLPIPEYFPDTYNAGKLSDGETPAHRRYPVKIPDLAVQECKKLGAALKSVARGFLNVVYLDRGGVELSALPFLNTQRISMIVVETFNRDLTLASSVKRILDEKGMAPFAILDHADVLYVKRPLPVP